jgi:putative endonuclease
VTPETARREACLERYQDRSSGWWTAAAEPSSPYGGPSDLGRRGEEAAALYLASLGFDILERRFRTAAGEIDIVAREGDTLAFVEVKSRSSVSCGRPAEAVGSRKRVRLLRAAALYLLGHGGPDQPCRFDVVEILKPGDGDLRVRLIRDAFQAF